MQHSHTTSNLSGMEQTAQGAKQAREIFKLSDLDERTSTDLKSMFGLWKEADHCDKDDR
ncbi:hypothetical protein SB861_52310 [Paraburkholderia sp. SIMBA_049]